MPSSREALARIKEQQQQVVRGFLWVLFAVVAAALVINVLLLGGEYVEPLGLIPNGAILLLVALTIALNNGGRTRLAVAIAGGLTLLWAAIPPLALGIDSNQTALMLFFVPVVVAGLLLDRLALGVSTGVAMAVVIASPLLHGASLPGTGELDDRWLVAVQFGLVFVVLAFLLDRFGLRFQQTMRGALVEQAEAESQLRAEKGFSDAIIESLPGIFFVRDDSGRYVRWNGRFQSVVEFSDAELRDMDPLGLFDEEMKPIVASRIREVFEDGYASADVLLRSKSGGKHPYFLSATRVKRDGAEFLVGSGIDRSDLDRAETHIETLNHQLKERVERLVALHEIDRAIIGSLDIDLTLGVMLDQVTGRLHVAAGRILLFDPALQVLRFGASNGMGGGGTRGMRVRLGEGPSGRVARDREGVYLSGMDELSAAFRDAGDDGVEGFVAYAGVPLVAKGQLQGVLEVFDDEPFPASDDWHDFLEALSVQAAIALSNAKLFEDLERSNIELRLAYDTTIEGWSRALDLKDEETEGHSRRVTELAVQLAARLGIRGEQLVHVRRGALLHDIGKMGVPDRILLKPGKLDEEEWEVMKSHTTLAYELLNGISFLRPALAIPHSHHERWDGKGYPQGLKGEAIPIAARLFSVVDVFDALTSDRPYRQAWPRERAIEYIREQSGSHFDPAIVAEFLDMIGEHDRPPSPPAGGSGRSAHDAEGARRDTRKTRH